MTAVRIAAGVIGLMALGVGIWLLQTKPEPQQMQGIIGVPCPSGTNCAPARCTGGNTQDGPWWAHVIAGGLDGSDGVDMVDINGDGRLDLVSGFEQDNSVVVALHPGYSVAQKMWPNMTLPSTVVGVEDSIFVDVDEDGRFDVVAGGTAPTYTVQIAFGPVAANILDRSAWTQISLTAASGIDKWIKVAVGDMDGDDDLDVVAGGRNDPGNIVWYENVGTPRTAASWVAHEVADVGWTMALILYDADDDDDLDVIWSDRENSALTRGVSWAENVGAPGDGLTWTSHLIHAPTGGDPKFATLVDFDGDLDQDIIYPTSGNSLGVLNNNKAYKLINDGSWVFTPTTIIDTPANLGLMQALQYADMDADGIKDVIASSVTRVLVDYSTRATVSYFKGPGFTQQYAISGIFDGLKKLDTLIIYDVDNDGDPDVVTGEQEENQRGLIWYENCQAN